MKPPSYQATVNQQTAEETRRVLRGPLAPVNNALNLLEENIHDFITEQHTTVKIACAVIFLILYIIYFAFAVSIDADRAADLIYVTAFAFFCIVYWLIKKFLGRSIWKTFLKPISLAMKARKRPIRW